LDLGCRREKPQLLLSLAECIALSESIGNDWIIQQTCSKVVADLKAKYPEQPNYE